MHVRTHMHVRMHMQEETHETHAMREEKGPLIQGMQCELRLLTISLKTIPPRAQPISPSMHVRLCRYCCSLHEW